MTTRGKGRGRGVARGSSNSAGANKNGLRQLVAVPTTESDDYLTMQLQQANRSNVDFIYKVLDRLRAYEEDVDDIEAAYNQNTELPPPRLKKTATGTQSGDTGESNRFEDTLHVLQKEIKELTTGNLDLTNRNQDLDTKLKQAKHELSKRQSSATTRPASQRSAAIGHQHDSQSDTDTLKINLQTYRDEVKKLKTKCEQLQQELEKVRRENEVFQEDIETKTKDKSDHGKDSKTNTTEIERLQRDKSDHAKDREANDAKMTIENLQREMTVLKTNNEKKQTEVEQLRTDNSDYMKDRYACMKANAEMTTKIEHLQKEISELKTKNEKTQKEVEQLRKATVDHTKDREANDAKMTIENLQREMTVLKTNKEKQDKTIEALQEKAAVKKADNPGKKTGGGKADKSSSAEMITKLQNEIEGLRNRLSKMAGAQLVDNNPAIADLSDPNRPLSLGEKFSELYDNEWTDAMEELSNTIPNEKDVIQHLLRIVCDAYNFCHVRSDQFMDKINGTLSGFSGALSSETMPKEIAKTNKDYRKSLAVHVVNFLQKEFAEETKKTTKTGKMTEAYIERCVLVCWFMTVQDPKVVITMEAPKVFDEDRYKPYTKKGKHMDYLVWPVLHLHEGGPMIGKGVAQGKP